MPIHDWTRVDAGVFHAFHHRWISAISDALNGGILSPNYYAMPEQVAGGLGPDVLTLHHPVEGENEGPASGNSREGGGQVLVEEPKVQFRAESASEYYRRKKSHVTVRHVSDDRIVAVVEILSPGNKSGRDAVRSFVEKILEFVEAKVHLLLVDLFPPTKRDPNGIHARIWEEITEEEFAPPAALPLTLVAYESTWTVRAYIEPTAVGKHLVDMPLYLEPGAYVLIPLEATYQVAWASVPSRWKRVIETIQ